jgi:hypothetical protein
MTQKIHQPVFIGGNFAQGHADELRQCGLIPLVSDIASAVMQIDDRLKSTAA